MKISIIGGAGRVGSAIGFALLHSVRLDELVLVDILKDAVQGEALDLGHSAVSLSPNTKIIGTDDISKIKNSDIVIFAAGRPRKPDELREDLFDFNSRITKEVSEKIKKFASDSYVIVVTNPSTRLGKLVQETTGFPEKKIIVMDNQLDTARLRYYTAQETEKNILELKSRATGEHGETMEFELKDKLTPEQEENVKKLTKEAGLSIIKLKGHTCWGIAAHVAKEVKRITAQSH